MFTYVFSKGFANPVHYCQIHVGFSEFEDISILKCQIEVAGCSRKNCSIGTAGNFCSLDVKQNLIALRIYFKN